MKYILILLAILNIVGCSKNNDQLTKAPTTLINPQKVWVETYKSDSTDGTVHVVQNKLSEEEQSRMRTQYRRVNLVQLPIDAKFNANAYRITDESMPDYVNKAFIAPRIFSYGTQDGGKLAPLINSDDTTTLSFNVAFVDGINSSIQSPNADLKQITLPDSFLVKKNDELIKLFEGQYNAKNGLAPLPGCPKKVVLVVADNEFDVTPKDFASCDYFQLNTPMVFSLKVPNRFMDYILYQALYAGLVEVRATYETRVSYPIANVKITFDREKVYEEIKTELGVKTAFIDADVKVAVTKIMQKQTAKVVIQGDQIGSDLSKIVNQVISEFFTEFKPDPDNPVASCSNSTVCLRLNYASMSQSSTIDFTWSQVTNSMEGQNLLMSTKLKPTPRTSVIGKGSDCVGDCHRLSNHEDARETGLTVLDGNQIVIQPLYAVQEHKDFQTPVTNRTHNSVCIREHKECEHMKECHGRNCINALMDYCDTVCDQSEDRWTDITQYSSPESRYELMNNPSGLIKELYDGLYAHFSWTDRITGKNQTLDCPLSLFPRVGESQQLEIKLMNVPTCKPFSNIQEETPMLYIGNRISSPFNYLSGRKVETWNGSVLENPTNKIFDPEIQLALKITMKGFDFAGDFGK